MTCPNCQGGMTPLELSTHLGRSMTIDLCFACQVFWFDDRESLNLSPAATLKLFKVIGEAPAAPRQPANDNAVCPHCACRLMLVQDMQRTTRFQYRRCPNRHGRLETFFDFLREKNFVRPMPAADVAVLREQIGTVNCSNCGAAVDLVTGSVCGHCGSPLSILDARQAEALVAQLQHADNASRPVDPALPLRLAAARREVAASFEAFERESDRPGPSEAGDLVMAHLRAFVRWLG